MITFSVEKNRHVVRCDRNGCDAVTNCRYALYGIPDVPIGWDSPTVPCDAPPHYCPECGPVARRHFDEAVRAFMAVINLY